MEFGKRHDITDTTDFCPRQFVTDLLRTCRLCCGTCSGLVAGKSPTCYGLATGNWCNGFWPLWPSTGRPGNRWPYTSNQCNLWPVDPLLSLVVYDLVQRSSVVLFRQSTTVLSQLQPTPSTPHWRSTGASPASSSSTVEPARTCAAISSDSGTRLTCRVDVSRVFILL